MQMISTFFVLVELLSSPPPPSNHSNFEEGKDGENYGVFIAIEITEN